MLLSHLPVTAQGDPGRLVTLAPGVCGGGRCRIRVIDTFGPEPAYNHEEYATLHGYRTNWGYWNLNPKQFMTMFRECLAWAEGVGVGRWGPSEVAAGEAGPTPSSPSSRGLCGEGAVWPGGKRGDLSNIGRS